jgi:peroxiredoxin (alkyl hydroperoxide reductase subunit C)
MSTLVTQKAPDFVATAVMANNSFGKIRLSDYRGKYTVLFFYPLDFTFVCPSEILAFNRKVEEFNKKDCQLIGISVDSHFTHLAWKETEIEKGGIGNIQYPLVSDIKKEIARTYGVLHDGSVALRGLFLIDKEGVVRHAVVNDLPLGRNVGEEAMKPTAEGVAEYLAKHAQ